MKASGLGVDLVEYRKARRFYQTHQTRLRSFFSTPEIKFITKAKIPYKNMAKLLAAKEAVFKAGNRSWMGVKGFQKINSLALPKKFRIIFIENKNHVVSICRMAR